MWQSWPSILEDRLRPGDDSGDIRVLTIGGFGSVGAVLLSLLALLFLILLFVLAILFLLAFCRGRRHCSSSFPGKALRAPAPGAKATREPAQGGPQGITMIRGMAALPMRGERNDSSGAHALARSGSRALELTRTHLSVESRLQMLRLGLLPLLSLFALLRRAEEGASRP